MSFEIDISNLWIINSIRCCLEHLLSLVTTTDARKESCFFFLFPHYLFTVTRSNVFIFLWFLMDKEYLSGAACCLPSDRPICCWSKRDRVNERDSNCLRCICPRNAESRRQQRVVKLSHSNENNKENIRLVLTVAIMAVAMLRPIANGADPLTSVRFSSQTPWIEKRKFESNDFSNF